MATFIRKHRAAVIILIIIITAAVCFSLYRISRLRILDKQAYTALYTDIEHSAQDGLFDDQSDLKDYITDWADSKGLNYKTDKAGNIIFTQDAVSRKKSVPPTVVCVSYNYETAYSNARLLASAAMIAGTELASGRKTVVFVNDEQSLAKGYKKLSGKLFPAKSKVIYMDYGSSLYASASSFAECFSSIIVPGKLEKVSCDTAVRISICGITSDVVGPGITKHPDPIGQLGTLLTRLESKSTICQLADVKVGSNGNMYPVSLDAEILLNSYALSGFTKYLDKCIKEWNKEYAEEYPGMSYTYEVIEDPAALPEKAYSRATVWKLANVLYTVKTGIYKFEESDEIPEGKSVEDIYGLNCTTGLEMSDNDIHLKIMTQGYDETYIQRIISDNTAAAEISGCSITEPVHVARFNNTRDSLIRTIKSTYKKVMFLTDKNSLKTESDSYFTPCSYLAEKGKKPDVIHIRLNNVHAGDLTNTILFYIENKGNLLKL